MPIQKLKIERLRNVDAIVLQNLQQINLFYGQNGSGKTTLLEAIHLLATGRSFRTHIPKHYIQYKAADSLIYAELENARIGMQKQATGEQVMRVNGDQLATQGQLAKLLPVQIIEPQSTDIIDLGSKLRRQMLDWLMFHVEPEFYPIWQSYTKALKQRNALLKLPYQADLKAHLAIWDQILASEGEKIHAFRCKIVAEWQEKIKIELQALLPDMTFTMDYYAGFSTQLGLAQQLEQEIQKDFERKTTQHGVHRADLRFKTELGDAENTCSRGQKKMIIMALRLAQVAMLQAVGKPSIVLLDDLTAELDLQAQQRLITRLAELGSQVFITVLDVRGVQAQLDELGLAYQMFHVEQGQIHQHDVDLI